jgi:hypothetical protein
MLAEPGGGHDAVIDLQRHRVVGDVKSHSGAFLGLGGPESK